jgi:hypothetical protein
MRYRVTLREVVYELDACGKDEAKDYAYKRIEIDAIHGDLPLLVEEKYKKKRSIAKKR